MTPYQLAEARRLHAAGLKLVELYPGSKQPVGDGWNLGGGVAEIRTEAGGYGMLLAANGMCSVDPDNEELAIEGLWRCGFDLDDIRDAGVATTSSRPGSGGRVAFKVPVGAPLRWLKFSRKKQGTILELRASSQNLQDTLPGTVYFGKGGVGPYVQDYAGLFTLDTAPELSGPLLAWWRRMSEDVDYLRAQQLLFVGEGVQLSISSGDGKLAYASPHRVAFNSTHKAIDILRHHGYTEHRGGRLAPKTATGAPAVRLIPGRDDLWQSDHASDPLFGTFDAWSAHVVLDHGDDLIAAEKEAEEIRAVACVDGFEDYPVPVSVQVPIPVLGTGGVVRMPLAWPPFEHDAKGKAKPTVGNLLMAMPREDIIGCRIAVDTFTDELVTAPPGTTDWRPFTDNDYVWIRARLETGMNGFAPLQKEQVKDVIKAVASNQKFDSAQDRLNALVWDGVERVATFFSDYFGVADTPYHRAVSFYTWTALAGRTLSPGCQADMAIIFFGDQGAKKTNTIKAMALDIKFFGEVSFTDSDDNMARKMKGKNVGEIAELNGIKTKTLESVKANLSRTHETWVPKYQEFATTYPRRAIFFGSTNDVEFLMDKSGHRRFLPITVGSIDKDAIAKVAEQMWAEGREIYLKTGIQYAEAEILAKAEHSTYEPTDSWHDTVEAWLLGTDFDDTPNSAKPHLTTVEVLVGALNFEVKHIKQWEQQRVGAILTKLGYTRTKKRFGNTTKNVYVKNA